LTFTSGHACIFTDCNRTCIYINVRQLWSVNSTKWGWILQTSIFHVILDGEMGGINLFLNFIFRKEPFACCFRCVKKLMKLH
jgi:hypothetical protein